MSHSGRFNRRHPNPGYEYGDEPVQIAGSLDRLLGHLRKPSAQAITTIFERWSVIVGAELAGHSEPIAIANERLVVRAYDPSAAASLRWLSADIVAAINSIGPGVELRDITIESTARRVEP
jgi:hypothetical protein